MLHDKNTSRLAFLFISYVVIASGYVKQVLPCQTQRFMSNSVIAKHIIGILLCFLFIMLEGGWSFDKKDEEIETDWSNGNTLHTLGYGLILYILFLLSAKMKLIPNLLLYFTLFIVYVINTQKLFLEKKKVLDEKSSKKINITTDIFLYLSIIIFLYGIIDYYIYKRNHYGKKFSFLIFILGNNKCSKTIGNE